MNKLRSICLCVSLVMTLISCSSVYDTQYQYLPPKSDAAKICIAQCVQERNVCDRSCYRQKEICQRRAHQNARIEYQQYKEEQNRNGFVGAETIEFFDRSSSCNNTCQCESTYRSCYTGCGGEVTEQQVCVAFCGHK